MPLCFGDKKLVCGYYGDKKLDKGFFGVSKVCRASVFITPPEDKMPAYNEDGHFKFIMYLKSETPLHYSVIDLVHSTSSNTILVTGHLHLW